MASVVGYHFTVSPPLSRSKGQSAVAKAAYNAREALQQDATNQRKDYTRGHSECAFSGIFAPKDAPAFANDRGQLWNEVERVESRKNSQFARPIEVALPHQLNDQQREWLVKDFVRENFTRKGMIADVAIHRPDEHGDSRNHHAHILLTLRGVDENGFTGNKVREWNSRESLTAWREDFAAKASRQLRRAGFELEADRWQHAHLSLGEQQDKALERGDMDYATACAKEPGKHLGPTLSAMERAGVELPERFTAREEMQAAERELTRVNAEIERIAPEEGRAVDYERLPGREYAARMQDFGEAGEVTTERNPESDNEGWTPGRAVNDNEREEAPTPAASIEGAAEDAAKGVAKGVAILAEAAGKMGERLAEGVGSFFEGLAGGATKLSPEQIAEQRSNAAEEAKRQAVQNQQREIDAQRAKVLKDLSREQDAQRQQDEAQQLYNGERDRDRDRQEPGG